MRKKKIIFICMMAFLISSLFIGCEKNENIPIQEKQETEKMQETKESIEENIGIIGAMDVEVDSLKESADIKNITKIADMEFCEGTIGEKML